MARLTSSDMSKIIDDIADMQVLDALSRMHGLVFETLTKIKLEKDKFVYHEAEYTELAKSKIELAEKVRDSLNELEEIEKIYDSLLKLIQEDHIPFTYLALVEKFVITPFDKIITIYKCCKTHASGYIDKLVMINLLDALGKE